MERGSWDGGSLWEGGEANGMERGRSIGIRRSSWDRRRLVGWREVYGKEGKLMRWREDHEMKGGIFMGRKRSLLDEGRPMG